MKGLETNNELSSSQDYLEIWNVPLICSMRVFFNYKIKIEAYETLKGASLWVIQKDQTGIVYVLYVIHCTCNDCA